jgi:hypothetical protein
VLQPSREFISELAPISFDIFLSYQTRAMITVGPASLPRRGGLASPISPTRVRSGGAFFARESNAGIASGPSSCAATTPAADKVQ